MSVDVARRDIFGAGSKCLCSLTKIRGKILATALGVSSMRRVLVAKILLIKVYYYMQRVSHEGMRHEATDIIGISRWDELLFDGFGYIL